MSVEEALFWVFGACIVLGAAGVIFARNTVNSAMALVATFFFLAGIYVLLWAHTIAILQVLVYAGAIMVLFLFVIMLLSLTEHEPLRWRLWPNCLSSWMLKPAKERVTTLSLWPASIHFPSMIPRIWSSPLGKPPRWHLWTIR